MDTEADKCWKKVIPKLVEPVCGNPPYAINDLRSFTDGRIVFISGRARRGRQKRADFFLHYRLDFPIAVVEAKSKYKHAADGLQQAKEYAEILGLKFAFAASWVRDHLNTNPTTCGKRSQLSTTPCWRQTKTTNAQPRKQSFPTSKPTTTGVLGSQSYASPKRRSKTSWSSLRPCFRREGV